MSSLSHFSALFIWKPFFGSFSMQATVMADAVGKVPQKFRPNLLEKEVRTFERIQKVIWDQLRASGALIIQR